MQPQLSSVHSWLTVANAISFLELLAGSLLAYKSAQQIDPSHALIVSLAVAFHHFGGLNVADVWAHVNHLIAVPLHYEYVHTFVWKVVKESTFFILNRFW